MLDNESNPETEECIHLIFPAAYCTICHPKKIEPPPDETEGRTMIAKFDGQCPDCNLPIYALTSTIKKRKGKWLHKRCADYLDRNR